MDSADWKVPVQLPRLLQFAQAMALLCDAHRWGHDISKRRKHCLSLLVYHSDCHNWQRGQISDAFAEILLQSQLELTTCESMCALDCVACHQFCS